MASRRRFDAILMDCQMPEMDGFEATRRIREQAAKAGKECAPIVALTADAFVEDRARCLNAGMTDYLSKPFTAACLRQVLAKHMKRAGTAPAPQVA
jgi:CheY-like chemotaxis protein